MMVDYFYMFVKKNKFNLYILYIIYKYIMKILLFGASGMLENYLYSYFKYKCICV